MIQARNYHRGRTRAIRLVVIHCTVSPEKGTGAEAVANYFATTTRRASAHKVVDNDSVVTCVADEDTAFGAGGANADGLHLELVGMPQQTEAEWLDAFGAGMLPLAAGVVREWCAAHDIPARRLTVAEVRDGVTRGITDHATVEAAFPSTGHWDPGAGFPWPHFIALVTDHKENDDIMATFTDEEKIEVLGAIRLIYSQLGFPPGTPEPEKHTIRNLALWTLQNVAGDDVDEEAIATAVLAGLTPAAIAAAVTAAGIAAAVADEIGDRLSRPASP